MALNVPTNVTASSVANRQISATTAWLLYLAITNGDSVPRYFALYDSASAPTALDAPVKILGPIAAGQQLVCGDNELGGNGTRFTRGIYLQTVAHPAAPTVVSINGAAPQRQHTAGVAHNLAVPTVISSTTATINAWIA